MFHCCCSELDIVRLCAEVGTFQTQVVPLRNAGNITIDVTLEVTHCTHLFALYPSQLQIEPGGLSEVTVKFESKERLHEKIHRYVRSTMTSFMHSC